jgi:hypothetical protein
MVEVEAATKMRLLSKGVKSAKVKREELERSDVRIIHLRKLLLHRRLRCLDLEEKKDEEHRKTGKGEVHVEQPAPLSRRSKSTTNRRTDSASECPDGTDDSEVGASLGEGDEVGDDDFGLTAREKESVKGQERG